MGERYIHQGATTGNMTYPVTVRCIYSGNKRTYYTGARNPDEKYKDRLRDKFMREECDCPSCTIKRKDRKKMVNALRRDKQYDSLRALGENI